MISDRMNGQKLIGMASIFQSDEGITIEVVLLVVGNPYFDLMLNI